MGGWQSRWEFLLEIRLGASAGHDDTYFSVVVIASGISAWISLDVGNGRTFRFDRWFMQ